MYKQAQRYEISELESQTVTNSKTKKITRMANNISMFDFDNQVSCRIDKPNKIMWVTKLTSCNAIYETVKIIHILIYL